MIIEDIAATPFSTKNQAGLPLSQEETREIIALIVPW